MRVWEVEESVETSATAEQIWALWSNPSSWPSWDDGIQWVRLDGPFAQGIKGILKAVNGPEVKFELIEINVNSGFRDRSSLPLTSLDFIHTYTPASSSGAKARITHRVEMRGWLTPIFKRVIGINIKKGLPGAIRNLVALAEKTQ